MIEKQPDLGINLETGRPPKDASWMDQRRGKFTASRLGDLMKTGRAKDELWGQAAMTYIYEVINAMTTGQDHIVTSKSLEWGEDHEWDAIEAYQELTGVKVERIGFVEYTPFAGGTPDGLVGDDGMIEVKCPFNGANHVRSILEGYIKPEYYLQMQGNMLFSGRVWCDYVSYDPRQIDGLMLHIQRVEWDGEIIDKIEKRLKEAKQKLDELINNLKIEQ